jgi:hypothetical protein
MNFVLLGKTKGQVHIAKFKTARCRRLQVSKGPCFSVLESNSFPVVKTRLKAGAPLDSSARVTG